MTKTRFYSVAARLLFAAAAVASAITTLAAPKPIPAPPAVNASAYLVVEPLSGKVIAEKDAALQVEPASITKLMTAYVVFTKLREGQLQLTDPVLISEKAWRTPGSRTWVEVGSRVTVEELLKGMIIQSGNDASVALAEHLAGTEETFALMMNQYAAELGLQDSYFVNSNGLPAEGHTMSARDIAVLAQALIFKFPDYYSWYSEKAWSYNGIEQFNRNSLLWRDESVDGLKTGHTDAAGYCLVSSAERDGMRLISVVLGTPSKEARAAASQSLLNYGFNFYETHLLYSAGQEITRAKVWKGEKDNARLGLANNLYVTIARGDYAGLAATMNLRETLSAPLVTSDSLGEVVVAYHGEPLVNQPLFPLENIATGSLFRRAVDEVMLWFE